MNAPECSRSPTARPPSWLDIEIPDEILERYRFLWLGLVVLLGACIPGDRSDEHVVTLLLIHAGFFTGLISLCWMRLSLWLKCLLFFSCAGLSFVHRELPMPGLGYGFLSSLAHWPAHVHDFQSLARAFGLLYLGAFFGLLMLHFGMPVVDAWLGKPHLLPERAGEFISEPIDPDGQM